MLIPVRTVPPDVPPVSTEDAKAHLRIDIDDEDSLIDALILSATEYLENILGRALIEQTWEQSFSGAFCNPLRLARAPVSTIESVTYIDSAGDEQTLDANVYRLLTDERGPKLILNSGTAWPGSATREDAITVEFVAGYGSDGSNVPAPLKQAILLLVGHWYENREPTAGAAMSGLWQEIPLTVSTLIRPFAPGGVF